MATNLSLSAQRVVLDLLRYIGVVGFAPADNDQALNQPGLDDQDIDRAISAINSGLQTIQKYGPQDMRFGKRSGYFGAPVTVTLAVTQGSKTATASVAPAPTNLGCSILIAGDANLNRVMLLNGATVTLLKAYLGANNASVNATIYQDCALLEDAVQSVLEPVEGSGNVRLHSASSIDDFDRIRDRNWSSMWNGNYYPTVASVASAVGTPVKWITERERSGRVFLRLCPMPAAAFNADFQAKLRAERITAALAIGAGPSYTDPEYYFNSLSDDDVEGTLLPIARWRFFAHPALKNAESAARVKAEYDEVFAALKHGITFASSVPSTRARYR